MRERLLVIGAKPEDFIGPWIGLSDAKEWEIVPQQDYGHAVVVEAIDSEGANLSFPLDLDTVSLSGFKQARVIVQEHVDAQSITVMARAIS